MLSFTPLALVVALLAGSQEPIPTIQADFLAWQGAAYVPSAVYAVKPASVYERFWLSADGTQLAFVSPTPADSPARVDVRLASGGTREGALRIGVWSRETGRVRDAFVPNSPKTSIDPVAFLGHDLVFGTSTDTGEGMVSQLWLARQGTAALPIEIPGLGSVMKLLSSKRGDALVVVGSGGAWLLDAAQRREIRVPGTKTLLGRGVSADGRAILMTSRGSYVLVDFATGATEEVEKEPTLAKGPGAPPFILDSYQMGQGAKRSLVDDDGAARTVDAKRARFSDEDGGYALDLVERTGNPRRRIPFLHETARTVEISENGLAFAFVSNRTLMVRWMVKTDRTTSRRLLGN